MLPCISLHNIAILHQICATDANQQTLPKSSSITPEPSRPEARSGEIAAPDPATATDSEKASGAELAASARVAASGEQKKGVQGSLNEGDHWSSQFDRGGSGRRGSSAAVEVARQQVEVA